MLELSFNQLVDFLNDNTPADAAFTINLTAENSQFIRFNQAKVRQTGQVQNGVVRLTYMQHQRSGYWEFPLTGDLDVDRQAAAFALDNLKQEVPTLPEDPYLVLPQGNATSREIHAGDLLEMDQVEATLLPRVLDLDFAGIYAAGQILRGYADSAGQKHWFSTDSFSLDYSVFTPDGQAVKGTLAGNHWKPRVYDRKIQESRIQLARLSRPTKTLRRGQYRTYFEPAALAEISYMLSWEGVSEACFQQGSSCFAAMRRGERQLSPKFYLQENFSHGLVPRFNEFGEVAPNQLPIIAQGKLNHLLVSSKTAQEYKIDANGANETETLRAPEIGTGDLSIEDVFQTLDTGLYISNLHYLNWSDQPTGRITGMTRYACFWVEDGEIVAPIENLRFDESLYNFWGDKLIALTDTQEFIPDVASYGNRALGGVWTPGMLVDEFSYTL
ncbi:TldD/PmbA family protein [filamentous cyanobacterium LEGE 11480]|uniref:TldD/PmbA family protein n=1 Tax=Romeriopsis navalis LEGE 11480 TaxID=2777977 RepID=A0A928Z4U2_9CYAN|nr:metallopeptidase TldD-related protein [Romeriopsis navalis]MBE9030753.1 TldD/PmbA family protein [Romeriopsis navalis LEGE 11480]